MSALSPGHVARDSEARGGPLLISCPERLQLNCRKLPQRPLRPRASSRGNTESPRLQGLSRVGRTERCANQVAPLEAEPLSLA
jgi:hypothetical protein